MSTAESSQTRDERICRERYEAIFADLRAHTKATDKGRSADEDEPLSVLYIAKRIFVTVQLSAGGPSDGFKLFLDWDTKEILGGCYYYQNWFTHAEEPLTEEDCDLLLDFVFAGDPASALGLS